MTVSTLPDGAESPLDDTDPEPVDVIAQRISTKWPALIVLGIAVFIVILGVLASILDSGNPAPYTLHTVNLPEGIAVPTQPGSTALSPIESNDEPPADVLAGVVIPQAGKPVGSPTNSDQNQTQYDRTMQFAAPMTSDELTEFFAASLPKLGSSIISNGPDPYQANSTEILSKRGSGDGYYWEIGVVISPTSSTGITPFSVRLFEIPDAD